mgnify:CR=1 FL=1
MHLQHCWHIGFYGCSERITDLICMANRNTRRAHGPGDVSKAWILKIGRDTAAIKEVQLVSLLRTPLLILEDDGDDRNPLELCGPAHRAHRLLRHSVIS